jgi:hypothetical protein
MKFKKSHSRNITKSTVGLLTTINAGVERLLASNYEVDGLPTPEKTIYPK